VVERRSRPGAHVVASRAGGREIRHGVVWRTVWIEAEDAGVVVIRRMAAIASRWQSRVITGVMATDVRARAGRDGVRTLQRERGRAVVE
jgi:hypothetical protein